MNHSSTRFPGCSRASPSITPGKVFEPLLRLRVGLGVDRPRLLPREVEALEQPEHPALAVADPEPLLDQGAQVAGAPGDAAVAPEPRAPEDQRLERGLLTLVEGAGPTGAGSVAQALDVLGVVAVHPVPERLAGHAGELRRLLAGEALQRVGEREQAGADPAIALAAGGGGPAGPGAGGGGGGRGRGGGAPRGENPQKPPGAPRSPPPH